MFTVEPSLFVTTFSPPAVAGRLAPYFMPVSVTFPITASEFFLRSDTFTAAFGVSVFALSNLSQYVALLLTAPVASFTTAVSIADPTLSTRLGSGVFTFV